MQSRMVWFLCLLPLFFSGCSSKEEQAFLQTCTQKRAYYKQLLHTEKVQLYDANETQVLLTATYLFTPAPGREEDDRRNEHFIIGLYMEDRSVTRKLLAEKFTLRLDGEAPSSITIVQRSDNRLKQIPFITPWGNYFEVVFPHTTKRQLTLLFSSGLYGKSKLHFAKKAKYLFTKEPF